MTDHPLTSTQREVWFYQQLYPAVPLYNIGGCMAIQGPVDPALLKAAIERAVMAHDSLRIELAADTDEDGVPLQRFREEVAVDLPLADFSAEADPDATARAWAEKRLRQPFALTGQPLFRFALLKLADDRFAWFEVFHHLVIDGWGIGVFNRTVSEAYTCLAEGSDPQPHAPSYGDYAEDDRRYIESPRFQDDRAFWLSHYPATAEPLFDPMTGVRDEGVPVSGQSRFILDPAVSERLRRFAGERKTTIFHVLIAALYVYLTRIGQRDEIAIGLPVLNRSNDRFRRTLGLFASVNPARLAFGRSLSFAALLDGIKDTLRANYRHQRFPVSELIRALGHGRTDARLFDIVLSYEPFDLDCSFAGHASEPQTLLHGHERTPLMLFVREYTARQGTVFEYAFNRAHFDEEAIAALHARLAQILSAVPDLDDTPVAGIPAMTDAETALLASWNATEVEFPREATVHSLFEAQVRAIPEAEAVADGEERLSYRDLNARANRLAHRLIALGAGPGQPVAVRLDRSAALVIAALATLKAGGVYLPLDPALPATRLIELLDDAQPAVLVTDAAFAGEAPCPVLRIDTEDLSGLSDTDPAPRCGPNDLAYIIFTSGSTGRPKGVMVEHRSLVNMLSAFNRTYALGPGDRMAMLAAVGFDVSISEIVPPLCAGAALVVAGRDDVLDPRRLSALLARERITLFGTTPLLLGQLTLDRETLPHLRQVFSGGEALSLAHAAGLPVGVPLVNGYGPTEATIGATAYRLRRSEDEARRIPIGRPSANQRVYILDAALRPLPIGVAGELCIAGEGVARGYLHRPELTAERFVEVEVLGRRERLYRTGDKARWRSDGELEFLGRLDRQIKLRGFRIELGEIEGALAGLPGVTESVVVVTGDGADKRLLGYAAGPGLDGEALKAALKERLPGYMVPSAVVVLERLPLTANGKVDVKQLPEPGVQQDDTEPPRTATERALAELWSVLLHREVVSRTANFFDLGGHSLIATRLTARVRERFGTDMPLSAVFETGDLEAMARWIETRRNAATLPPIVPQPGDAPRVLSFAQQRLWFLEQLEGGSPAYSMPGALRLRGPLDRAALRESLIALEERHEGLRQVFERAGDEPRAAVRPAGDPLTITDLSGGPEDRKTARLQERIGAQINHVFDLERGPLFRAELVVLDADTHVLLVNMHHIVSDGWSVEILLRDWTELYAARVENRAPSLPPLPIRYADYAAWQREHLRGPVLKALADHWTEALDGAPHVLDLPADRPRPDEASHRGGNVRRTLPPALGRALTEFGQSQGATPFMTLLAAFGVLLGKLSGQDDLLIGTPVANRMQGQTENLIGFFVNTLALRCRIDGTRGFDDLLRHVRKTALDAYAHQELPFETLVEAINPERSLGRTPLFQVMFSFQNAGTETLDLAGLEVKPIPTELSIAKFDLSLGMGEGPDGLVCDWEFARDLFDAETVERMADRFETLLDRLAADPTAPLADIGLLTPNETALLYAWNATETEFPREATVHSLFEAQVRATPEAEAVADGEDRLSYRALNARANRLAHRLIALGVGPGQPVAVRLDRSAALVIAALATLKAGGVYLPLDPALPATRLDELLADAQPAVLVTDAAFAGAAPCPVLRIDTEDLSGLPDTDPPPRCGPNDLAYIIFTSGSSGRPKGVMVEHRSLVNMLSAFNRTYALGPGDRMAMLAAVGFDVSISEIVPPLCAGAALVVAGRDDVLDPRRLSALLARERITLFGTTPLLLGQLTLDRETLPHLRQVFSGGEALSLAHAAGLPAGVPLVNGYGPTEATIGATAYRLRRSEDEARRIPIGRPSANQRVYILDAALRPLPLGVAGELCIAGEGVARGYLNRPELTAERFVEVEVLGGRERLYRTGDKARWRADGELEFLGRLDRQIKLRGFRIELGEIEGALAGLPGVTESVVVVTGEGADKRLTGYAAGAGLDGDALKTALKERLPGYMVPSAVVVLERLPLTANGKVDVKQLPEPERLDRDRVAPRDEVEQAVAAAFTEVLDTAPASIHDSFFELGGHSFRATKLTACLRAALGVSVPVRWVFEAPTVAELAQRLRPLLNGETGTDAEVPPNRIAPGATRITPDDLPLIGLTQAEIDAVTATVTGGAANIQDIYPLSPLQEGLLYHHLIDPHADPYQSPTLLAFDTLEQRQNGIDGLQAVTRRHDILRTAVVWAGVSRPVQVVWREAPVPVETPVFVPANGPVADQLLAYCRSIRIDPAQAPLRRVVVAEDGKRWLLGLVGHHLTLDHTTNAVLLAEARAIVTGQADRLPPPVPYREFIARLGLAQTRDGHEAFFRAMLGSVDRPTAPFGLLGTQATGAGGEPFQRALPGALAGRITAASNRLGTTPAALFHLVFGLVLARCCAQDDVVFGTVLFGRLQGGASVERALGLFINTLPLRVTRDGRTAIQALRDTQRNLMELMRHEHASLALAQRCSALPPPAPLFSALLNYRHSARVIATEDGFDGLTVLHNEERSNYPFVLTVDDFGDDGFGLTVFVDSAVDPRRVASLAETTLDAVLSALESAPGTPLNTLAPLPETDAALLASWNATEAGFPREAVVHALFEAQVRATPEAEAVADGEDRLSYRALNARANRLAHRLIALGAGPGQAVAVCLERSAAAIAALLAVLKAGGVYLPVAADQPPFRRSLILEDGKPAILVTDTARASTGFAGPTLYLDREDLEGEPDTDPAPRGGPDDLAYILFTSGSTGRPKGAAIAHRSLVNFVHGVVRAHPPDDDDRVLQMATLGFDMSISEIVPALCSGAALVIAGRDDTRDPERLVALMARERITRIVATPSLLSQLAFTRTDLPCLRRVFSGGEALARAHLAGLPADVPVVNVYGPTETTVWATEQLVRRDETGAIPIGKPGPNQRIYVLDEALQPLPIGAAGELCIAGEGVARGYLDRPDLTAGRFAEAELFGRRERIYRTGDKARWREDGALEFLGRLDRQIKLRGHRIELDEIENALKALPGVSDGFVAVRGEGADMRLIGYATGTGLDPAALKAALQERLPGHMVPSALAVLDRLPLTANGKIDTAALPEPDLAPLSQGAALPRNEREMALIRIWEDVLGVSPVGIDSDFFALGGHSLLAIRLMGRIRARFGRSLPLSALLTRPTIAGLAPLLEGTELAADSSRPVDIQPLGSRVPLYLLPGAGGHVLCYAPLSSRLGPDQPAFGLEVPGLYGEAAIPQSVEEHAERLVKTLRTHRAHGPYRLLGHSAGGITAFEMARILEREGEEVSGLFVLDVAAPLETFEPPESTVILRSVIELIEIFTGESLSIPAEELAAAPGDDARYELIAARIRASGSGFDAIAIKRYVAVYDAMIKALCRYRPAGPVRCPITVIAAAETVRDGDAYDWGWQSLCEAPIRRRTVNGTHLSMLMEPDVRELARLIEETDGEST